MCGIAGVYKLDQSPLDVHSVVQMTTALQHRGPDDAGYLFYNRQNGRLHNGADPDSDRETFHVGLGHRRLSIIDLSTAGHQPMTNEDGTIWLIYNGEIYNYLELRDELEPLGHRFASHTDSEAIIHAYEQWGTECLHRFNGMWAFALLDRRDNSLFCARDRFGIKPFYFCQTQNTIYFASEMKALIQLPEISTEIDANKVLRYLVWGLIDDDEQTLLKAVKRLRPGFFLQIKNGHVTAQRYYDLQKAVHPEQGSEEENARRFRELFQDAVRLRLRSDVPLGTCLSGGLDSSAIVSIIRRLDHTEKLYTFSAIFTGETVDESPHVHTMVDFVAAKPFFTTPTGDELVDDLEQLIRCQDEPFWSTSTYNHFRVMKLAKQAGVKVLLDGQGGDELLAGYHYYFAEYCLQLAQAGKWPLLWRELRALKSMQGSPIAKIFGQMFSLALPPAWRYQVQRRLFFAEKNVINRDFIADDGFYKHYTPITSDRILNRNFYDFSYSIPYLLRLEDRNSMAFSIESRVPFLDYRLVEFLFTVPAEQKIKSGITKYLLRRSLANDLPPTILDRKDKIGFFTPEQKWLRGPLLPLLNDTFHSQKFRQRGLYNMKPLMAYFDKFQQQKAEISYIVWRWFNLEKWLEQVEKRFGV